MASAPESREERVLVLAPTGRDAALTAGVLTDARIASVLCEDARAMADELARGGAGALLLAEEALTESALTVLLGALSEQPPWSDLPLVLIASEDASVLSNRRTLEVADRLGHVTLLDRPVRLISLLSAVRVAIRTRRRQYQARELLRRLQEGVEQRDRFLAMLGHELRNPLTAITYAVNRLPEDAGRSREIIQRQSSHLGRIVEDLLDVARITSNKVTLHRAVVDLREVVEGGVETTRLGNPRLRLETDLGAAEVCVDVDVVRMDQVVTNLLVNAAKYSEGDGTVHVSLRAGDGAALLVVRDDGVGIKPEMLSSIFDLFTQVDSSLDRARGGLGIGLTVVRGLVDLHGGSVRAVSAGLGRGTRFEVCLPLAARVAAAAEGTLAPPGASTRASGARHVLIVEDDPDIRENLLELLAAEGHVVDAAEDGTSAIARAQTAPPEVALVDIGLPGMNGYDVARALRRAFGAQIYLAAMTGYGMPEDRAKARDAGFDAHLTKPVDLARVERLVRSAPGR